MKELIIYEFQAKSIIESLEMASRLLECKNKTTCFDRDVMVAIAMLENVLNEKINTHVERM